MARIWLVTLLVLLAAATLASSSVLCEDGTKCGDGATCCMGASGSFMCCPFTDGVCCLDQVNCCPGSYRCNAVFGFCEKPNKPGVFSAQKASRPFAKLQAEGEEKAYIYCPDGSLCYDTNTCCPRAVGYGCCPFQNAVCCDDKINCCPTGTRCDLVNKVCLKASLSSGEPETYEMEEKLPSMTIGAPAI